MGRAKLVTNKWSADVWNELSVNVVHIFMFMLLMMVMMVVMTGNVTGRVKVIHNLLRSFSGQNRRLEEDGRNFRTWFGRSNAHIVVIKRDRLRLMVNLFMIFDVFEMEFILIHMVRNSSMSYNDM